MSENRRRARHVDGGGGGCGALALKRPVEYDGAGSIVILRACGQEETTSAAAEATPSKRKEEHNDGMMVFVLTWDYSWLMVGSKEDGDTGTGGSDDRLGDAVLDDKEGGELETLGAPLPCSNDWYFTCPP